MVLMDDLDDIGVDILDDLPAEVIAILCLPPQHFESSPHLGDDVGIGYLIVLVD
jgi:hypothetical protein